MAPTPEQVKATRTAALAAAAERGGGEGTGRMRGKVGIVTGVGPAAGIGTASARLYAREGAAALYLVDVSGALPAFATELAVKYPGTRVTAISGDAADEDVVRTTVQRAVDECGRLDFYFANAGVSTLQAPGLPPPATPLEAAARHMNRAIRPITEIPGSEFDEVMRINVKGPWLALKYAPTAMAATGPGKSIPGGSMILTASVAGRRSGAGPVIYSASKAAVVSLAQTSAYELAGQNVRVNAICPGLIETPMTSATFELASKAGKREIIGQLNPLQRYGVPAGEYQV
jgi:NAD(P)-dependent dehydrogenase (short-subunit alcohol dehydrogenase family)